MPVRRLAHRLILALAAFACFALASVCGISFASAKGAPRAILTDHHAQSKLTRIPKVRRVQRTLSHRRAILGSARRWDHRAKGPRAPGTILDPHVGEAFDLLEAEADASTPILEELEIETVVLEF